MQQQQKQTGLVWFRNNLRVHDNSSLKRAVDENQQVIAVYFFDPKYFKVDEFGFQKTAKFRAKFLIETIKDLQQNLADLNITLLTYFDAPEHRITSLCDSFFVDKIYTQKEWTRDEIETNNNIKKTLNGNIGFIEEYDQFLYHPETVSKNFNNIPDVFTAFRKKLEKYVAILEEVHISKLPKENLVENTTETPSLQDLGFEDFEVSHKTAFPFKGGETEALKRLNYYLFESKKVSFYKKTRNGLVGKDYSTKLSPWLANGSLSAKTICHKVKKYEQEFGKNQSTYWVIFELIWRDYFKYISLKYDEKIFKIGGILDRDYEWKSDKNTTQKWINGETRDDFVNANMIELKETGWMSNRGRQNVASYFAKELLLDWRIGAAYFESLLLDYDVHSNYGNWMYVAGVGNDPRDRKFNTQLQAERYDSNHKFRNLWLAKTLF
ncbi:DASH family cryptochrome [Polaribacter porphyrae]|uniref:Cryptochrome DASH n=1 Tax=Polaribacter porphyrae TaxID=1137780 RepID=A0A2S7WND0_9FLAO|nr:DASH family cryptochrome [Polaribacter porphyrae]PQJ79117.1 deoxyribodipyrimidine photolyase [Polaribacter porphyrae]